MGAAAALLLSASLVPPSIAEREEEDDRFPNSSGASQTFSVRGKIDTKNPFFQDLGTNERRCVTCHQPGEGWSVTPEGIRARFEATGGTDPIFRTNDGSNSPTADVSTVEARRQAYSMLLTKGVIRVGIGIPANAEFELIDVDDPYGFASAKELSLFRRPLPTTNIPFLTALMWDGREPDLLHQANEATVGHAAGAVPLTAKQRQQIVDFETGIFTTQVRDKDAGVLNGQGGQGGPRTLANQTFYFGINDLLGDTLTGEPFNNASMRLYEQWGQVKDKGKYGDARRAIARGEALFNSKQISITRVKGVNNNPDFGTPPVVQGFCTTCHNTPNVGNHSLKLALDLGLTDEGRRTPDMPLYTLQNKTTGETIRTTDPGLGLISGKWADIGRFKGPVLRGLAARAPYFHDGSAADLDEVLDFYQSRFGVTFTAQERSDLIAFLNAL